jgi:hypothetical protein
MTRMRQTLALTANARLTRITAPGPPDATGDPTAGTDVWTGSAPCDLERTRHDTVSGQLQDSDLTLGTLLIFAMARVA